MRYLALLFMHFVSILVSLVPILYFVGSWLFPQNMIGSHNLLLAAAICCLILPTGIGILTGILIDGCSSFLRSKPFYACNDWSRIRNRAIVAGLVSAGMVYIHFNQFS